MRRITLELDEQSIAIVYIDGDKSNTFSFNRESLISNEHNICSSQIAFPQEYEDIKEAVKVEPNTVGYRDSIWVKWDGLEFVRLLTNSHKTLVLYESFESPLSYNLDTGEFLSE